MQLSYSQLLSLYGQLTNNADTSNVSATTGLGRTLINSAYKRILGEMSWDFVEKETSYQSRAVTTTYALTFTNGSTTVTSASAISDDITDLYVIGADGLLYEVTNKSGTTITLGSPYIGATQTTTGDTNFLQVRWELPNDFKQMLAVNMDIGSTRWVIKEAPTKDAWTMLNNVQTYQGTYPSWYFIFNDQLYIWPVPAITTTRVNLTYIANIPDLTTADNTISGTLTFTRGSAVVDASGVTLPSLKNCSIYAPDGLWYTVQKYTSGTSITTTRPYLSMNASSSGIELGTTTLSGQLPLIPVQYHETIAYLAAADYYMMRDEMARAQAFTQKAEKMIALMKGDLGSKDVSVVIEDMDTSSIVNPNLYLRSIG